MADGVGAQEAFVAGCLYTRSEIYSHVGGGLQSCLVRAAGAVVAVCFVPKKNPRGPREIFVGRGPSKQAAAEILANQAAAVPVFEKAGSGRWKFVGWYKGEQTKAGRNELEEANALSGRTDIVAILPLKAVR